MFFKQNCDTEIVIKDYFTIVNGKTPKKDRQDYHQNGTIKFLSQKGLLDIYYLNEQVLPTKLITEKAVKEEKMPFSHQNSVMMTHMAQDENFRRRIVWCQTNNYTFNNLVANFIAKDKEHHNYYSAGLFFALRNRANDLANEILGSRGEGGKVNVGLIKNFSVP